MVVLCIENESLLLQTRALVLQSAGFGVLTARTPRDALDLFICQTVDAVLLGYTLRGLDTGELAAQMKGVKPHVPIMMIGWEHFVPEGLRRAVDRFVANSDGPRALIEATRALLGSAFPAALPTRRRRRVR